MISQGNLGNEIGIANNSGGARSGERVEEAAQPEAEELGRSGRVQEEEEVKPAAEESDEAISKKEETTLRAKTKTEDGGSQDAPGDGTDAFSRYSNTNVRMMSLLQPGNTDGNEDNTDWQELIGYRGLRRVREGVDVNDGSRKTRLSTELHPSAFFVEIFGLNIHD